MFILKHYKHYKQIRKLKNSVCNTSSKAQQLCYAFDLFLVLKMCIRCGFLFKNCQQTVCSSTTRHDCTRYYV